MKFQLWDCHRSLLGGGSLPMMALHNALIRLGHDVWMVGDTIHPDVSDYEFIWWAAPIQAKRIPDPDIFVHSCYWYACSQPWGKENWLYVLYPKPGWNIDCWDRIITVSEYSKAAIKRMWGRDADILIGGVYAADWYPAEQKEKAILSCSRFFIEGDVENLVGHSKNQHILIKAFQQMDLPSWELWLAGYVLSDGDVAYLQRCQQLAADNDNIKFYPTPTKEVLRDLYARASIFWHGMGYGREDPAEVEHYGYVLLKARMAGQWVMSHNSGNIGLSHCVWNEIRDLIIQTRQLAWVGAPPSRYGYTDYTRANFTEKVRRFLEQ